MAADIETLPETLTEVERACLRGYLDLVSQRLGANLLTVWLLGSAARGDMWPAGSPMRSDIDLLAVTGAPVPRSLQEELTNATYPLYLEAGRKISPQFWTAGCFQAPAAGQARDFVERVRAEGRLVWKSRLPLREQFILEPDVVFLNHGSFGACPRPVFEAYQRWQRELEAQPLAFFRRAKELLAQARAALAAYVGAEADDLVFVPNATTGLNIVARSLRLAPGDEVLATDHEYGALDRTWRFVCGRSGAAYVRAPVRLPVQSREEIVEAVWSRVTDRTRVLFISHITPPTALVLPVEELVRRARAAGILTVIDGAHAPGQIPLDLRALDADFYAGNCHKWLCAPKGSAFLYARRDVQPLLEPLVVSWGWRSDKPGPSRFIDEHEWQGTRDLAAFLAVPAAIEFLESHNWEDVRGRCHDLARAARDAVNALTGLSPLCPDDPAWYAQMASMFLPPCDPEAFQKRLLDEFGVEVPVWDWNGRPVLRVSVQGYNTREDIDALASALGRMIEEAHA